MTPGYRHIPLSQRLGISFSESSYWRVDMAEAECFMFFIAGLRQVFEKGDTLYIEGMSFDPEVEAFYRGFPAPGSPKIQRLLRHPKARAYHVPLDKEPHKILSRFATCKTFGEISEALLVYRAGKVLMDGSRIGERIALFSGDIPEPKIKKFTATRVNGSYEWVEEGRPVV
jgi:hypothetical protein